MSTENLDALLDQVRMHFVRIIESEKGQHRATTEVLAEVRAALKVPEHEPIVSYAKRLVAENADLQARLVDGAAAALTVTGRLRAEIDELKDEKRFGRDAPGIPVLVEALRDDCEEPVRRVLVRLLDRMGGDVMGSSMCTIQQLEDECHGMIHVHEERAALAAQHKLDLLTNLLTVHLNGAVSDAVSRLRYLEGQLGDIVRNVDPKPGREVTFEASLHTSGKVKA